MKPDEAAFETHITEWLTDHGGYAAWKLGTQSTDFEVNSGLDTAELFSSSKRLNQKSGPRFSNLMAGASTRLGMSSSIVWSRNLAPAEPSTCSATG